MAFRYNLKGLSEQERVYPFTGLDWTSRLSQFLFWTSFTVYLRKKPIFLHVVSWPTMNDCDND